MKDMKGSTNIDISLLLLPNMPLMFDSDAEESTVRRKNIEQWKLARIQTQGIDLYSCHLNDGFHIKLYTNKNNV